MFDDLSAPTIGAPRETELLQPLPNQHYHRFDPTALSGDHEASEYALREMPATPPSTSPIGPLPDVLAQTPGLSSGSYLTAPSNNWSIAPFDLTVSSASQVVEQRTDSTQEERFRPYLAPAYLVRRHTKGSLATFKPIVSKRPRARLGGGQRNIVTGYSKPAQGRLRRALAELDHEAIAAGFFATLTYPAARAPFPKDAKRHLQTWSKRFCRKFPAGAFLWKLEITKKGIPHFHLLILGAIPSRQWLAISWHEIAAPDEPAHLRAGTGIKKVKHDERVSGYLAKYESFATEAPIGRCWGHVGAWKAYLSPIVETVVTGPEAAKLRRVLDGYRRSRGRLTRNPKAICRARRPKRISMLRCTNFYGATPRILTRLLPSDAPEQQQTTGPQRVHTPRGDIAERLPGETHPAGITLPSPRLVDSFQTVTARDSADQQNPLDGGHRRAA